MAAAAGPPIIFLFWGLVIHTRLAKKGKQKSHPSTIYDNRRVRRLLIAFARRNQALVDRTGCERQIETGNICTPYKRSSFNCEST